MKTNKLGITLLPVILGIVVSLVIIITLLAVTVSRNNEEKKSLRMSASQMSDLGFQTLTETISSVEDFANDLEISKDTIFQDDGWYKLDVQKHVSNDTMYISISSIGGAGEEIVKQQKQFQLIRSKDDTGISWGVELQ